MEGLKLKKITEIDNGDDLTQVNKLLAEGWLLLQIRLFRRRAGNDEFNEYPVYILGLPFEGK